MPDVTLHDLRHCHAQWAADAGLSDAKLQVSLRHATPAMTRRYSKQRDKGDVAQAVGNALAKAAI
jgi:integrase